MNKKALFIIQGEGRGHMTQAISLLQLLRKNDYDICGAIIGSSERRSVPAFFLEKFEGVPVTQIQSPNFVTKDNRGISIPATVWKNLRRLKTYIRSISTIRKEVNKTKPDLIINFYEPLCGAYAKFTSRAKRPKVVSIAHQYLGIHPEFQFPGNNFFNKVLLKNYSRLTHAGSSRILALSFVELPDGERRLRVVPPLLRHEIKKLSLKKQGYFLCYLVNAGYRHDVEKWHAKNPGIVLHVFTDIPAAAECIEVHSNLFYHPLSDTKFLEYMSGCDGLISTAGFESVCESFYMDKPVFMVPVEGHFEQLCNAHDAKAAGAGIFDKTFRIDKFLEWLPSHHSCAETFRGWESKAELLFLKNFNELV